MKQKIFLAIFLSIFTPGVAIAYIHTPVAIIDCGTRVDVMCDDGTSDSLVDVKFWLWPDGCASATDSPLNETARCYYKHTRQTDNDIILQNANELWNIQDGVLTSVKIHRPANSLFTTIPYTMNLKSPVACKISTTVSIETIYPYAELGH